jgi:glycosyltransferase involved in cell wall biosynthesis
MKGILFILDSQGEPVGGIEGKVLLIARDLHERGMLAPVLITGDGCSYFARQFRGLALPVYELPMRNTADVLAAPRRVRSILHAHNVAVIQSHRFRESLIGRSIRRANPQLRHVFRVHTHIEGHDTPPWKKRFYHRVDGWTARFVDAFVPISELLVGELATQSSVPRGQIHVVRNGIPPLGPPDPPNLGQAPLPPAAAVIGDLEKRKQQDLAVEAIGLLHARGIDVALHVIGRDRADNASVLRQTAARHGVQHLVQLHGYRTHEEILAIVRNVPVFMLPSRFEGIPTCIIEGMSMRKLAITTPSGATAELVDHGVNGLMHSPSSAAELADRLQEVFTTPAAKWEPLRDAGYRTWRDRFSTNHMMNGLTAIYERLGLRN